VVGILSENDHPDLLERRQLQGCENLRFGWENRVLGAFLFQKGLQLLIIRFLSF
jgi:hypothetical protein